jgi:hypothetical protein
LANAPPPLALISRPGRNQDTLQGDPGSTPPPRTPARRRCRFRFSAGAGTGLPFPISRAWSCPTLSGPPPLRSVAVAPPSSTLGPECSVAAVATNRNRETQGAQGGNPCAPTAFRRREQLKAAIFCQRGGAAPNWNSCYDFRFGWRTSSGFRTRLPIAFSMMASVSRSGANPLSMSCCRMWARASTVFDSGQPSATMR